MTVEKDNHGKLISVSLKVSDQASEQLEPASLMMSEDNCLYCRIERHGMRVPCKFTPGQYYELALLAEMESEAAWLEVGEQRYQMNLPFDCAFEKIQ